MNKIWGNDGIPMQLVRIEGLIATSDPGVFELEGVKPRNVNWPAVREALGFPDEPVPLEDGFFEELSHNIWMFDIRHILVERCKPA